MAARAAAIAMAKQQEGGSSAAGLPQVSHAWRCVPVRGEARSHLGDCNLFYIFFKNTKIQLSIRFYQSGFTELLWTRSARRAAQHSTDPSTAPPTHQDPKLVAQIVLTQQSQHANHQLATQFVQMRQSEQRVEAGGKAAEGATDEATDPSMPTPADGAAAANAMAFAQQAVVNNGGGADATQAQAQAAAAAAALNMAASSSSSSGTAGLLGAAATMAQQQQVAQAQAQAQAQMQAAAAAQAQANVGVAYGGPAAALQEAAALSEASI